MADQRRARTDVVIVGGGFGGLYAAKALASFQIPFTLVDRRNFHLFQPLLYQVATGSLSPGDITAPIRSVVRNFSGARVLQDEVVDVRAASREVVLRDGAVLHYTHLIVAAGSQTSYFGHEEWKAESCGLKSIEEALTMRQRVLGAFERAEMETDPVRRDVLLTFVVIGGGPTGVELAGAIGELARTTLKRDFRAFDPAHTRVILVEAVDRLLPTFPASLSRHAQQALQALGVEVRLNARVTRMEAQRLTVASSDGSEADLDSATIRWAAGVTSSPFAEKVAAAFGAERDRGGRIVVQPDLTIAGHPSVFVIGDLAHANDTTGRLMPGLAPVAIQQGQYVARRIRGTARGPFRYHDKGQLAVIGRNRAVCDLGWIRLCGFPAWFIWVFVHIGYLIGFDNKLLVMLQWAVNYFTRKRGARLITFEPG
ncbi:MAG TPA: NAD(P)/FAD-dependent oxidoreductase, partial [Candidatus Krumholzibacteria bacterium]|nr:NAD(P)/FAD-dependent oxidoreductase [Candidatus Krumholzibacteria bacterium]